MWCPICIHGRSPVCTFATSVHRSSLFPFVLGFAVLTTMTWLYHVLGPRVMVHSVSASRHPRFGTCYHLISRTVMLVANSSSRALRLGSLCKPTHRRCLWELCLSGALQILDLIDWLRFDFFMFKASILKDRCRVCRDENSPDMSWSQDGLEAQF